MESEEEMPNQSCQSFYNTLLAANEPMYEGCSQSKLSISVRLLAARANWHIPQKCVDFFAEMFADLSPLRRICLRIITKQLS